MQVFQYNIPKVYVLYREMKDARSASPLFVGVGVNPPFRLVSVTSPNFRDHAMALLLKKMSHGSPRVLSRSAIPGLVDTFISTSDRHKWRIARRFEATHSTTKDRIGLPSP